MKPLFSFLLWAACLVGLAPAQVTAIRAGRLLDPETGQVQSNQTILVEGRLITAIGANVPIPAGATILDLSNATVLPGLFDAHTHLCLNVRLDRDRASYYYTTLNDPDMARAIDGVINARTMLEAGFTSVRDIGNEGNYACTYVRRAIEQGRIPGPTMLNAGRIIAPYGGQFQMQPEKREALAVPEYYFADTRDEMVKAIRENAHYGATVIKIVVDDQQYIYSTDDIRFMIAEAQRAGLKLAAHVWTAAGAHHAAEAGVASLEHLNGITDADLELAKRNGVTAVFTPFPEWVLREFRGPERARAEYAQEIDRLRAGYRIGIPVAFGTDAIHDFPNHTRGTQAMTWIDSYLEAGFTPLDLLRAMTVNAARLLGIDHQRGLLRTGLAADLIATPENPLDNPQTLKSVFFVMKNGQVVKHQR